ncbi:hypothetical protein [Leclercia adecarboxylata]|uniref:hypothetical protein n=1 Tax=Leclercia adecarboxylata TaxID=83655 RepID=UPI0013FE3A3F|nr:hypothetical protein [Leclercia adecarboxylata]QIM42034.1 hypothetical protein G7098_04465 [Leclercia adecarboxylata]
MISLRAIAKQYGYDESTVREWKAKGMPLTNEDETRQWIIDQVLVPLRQTDIREQIELERLRKMRAEADLMEAELQLSTEQMIPADEVHKELTAFFKSFRDYFRNLPNKIHHEVFEQDSALKVKRVLQQRIDELLTEIGDMKYEQDEDEQGKEGTDAEDENENKQSNKST